ncbi:MAG TPA: antitoxin Xre-like helix-turn-helix domain-containing protein [Candidatus Elarobacter sp.]|nr:antitoxin Xre-like helix-turn-helix domain-containing protein [Candidatus Elarobacter sp.]
MAALPAMAIAASLGGRSKLKREIRREWDLERVVRDGIPGSAIRYFVEQHGLDFRLISAATGVKGRTLERRLHDRFLPHESDRLLRFIRLYLEALDVHRSDAVTTERWFYTSIAVFENQRPVDHIDNEVGVRVAEGVLAAIRRDAERPIGLAAGRFRVDERFSEPLDDETLAAFQGNGP